MKLLFDENLLPRLVVDLAKVFPGSLHVRDVGLARADNVAVWRYALDQGFAIITKDPDFQERSQVAGSAPKVLWIRRGNCSTREIAALLRSYANRIEALELDPEARFLILL